MALKPTIYRAQIELADSDRQVYESLGTTLALHPSETAERMTVRLLAYCLQWQRALEFTRGISSTDEPDLWRHSDSGEIEQWIEVGQPEEPRLRKACGRAQEVIVYAFGASADTWWKRNAPAITALPRTQVWQFNWAEVVTATETLLERNMRLGVNIVGATLYVDNQGKSCSLEPQLLHAGE